MKYWAIDNNQRSQETVTLYSKRQIRIDEGDKIILFIRDRHSVKFISSAVIQNRMGTIGISEQSNRFEFKISPPVMIEHDLSAKDLRFSLEKVYRFSMPEKHFKRRYVSLSKNDFFTIVEKEIHIERTMLGEYLDALPGSIYTDFIRHLISLEINWMTHPNYTNILKVFFNFIDSEYLEYYRILQNMAELSKHIESKCRNFTFQKIELSDNTTDKGFNLELKRQDLESFFNIIDEDKELLKDCERMPKMSAYKFHNIFWKDDE